MCALAFWLLCSCSGEDRRFVELSPFFERSEWLALSIGASGLAETYILEDEGDFQNVSVSVLDGEAAQIEVAEFDVPLERWNLVAGRLEPDPDGEPFPSPDRAQFQRVSTEANEGWQAVDGLPPSLSAFRSSRLPSRCPRFSEWEAVRGPSVPTASTWFEFAASSDGHGFLFFQDKTEGINERQLIEIDLEQGTLVQTIAIRHRPASAAFDNRDEKVWGGLRTSQLANRDNWPVAIPGLVRVDVETASITEHRPPVELLETLGTTAEHEPRQIAVLEDTNEILLLTRTNYLLKYQLEASEWSIVEPGDPFAGGISFSSGQLAWVADSRLLYSLDRNGLREYLPGVGRGQSAMDSRDVRAIFRTDVLGPVAWTLDRRLFNEVAPGTWEELATTEQFQVESGFEVPDGVILVTGGGPDDSVQLAKKLHERPLCGVEDAGQPAFEVDGRLGAPILLRPAADGLFVLMRTTEAVESFFLRPPP